MPWYVTMQFRIAVALAVGVIVSLRVADVVLENTEANAIRFHPLTNATAEAY